MEKIMTLYCSNCRIGRIHHIYKNSGLCIKCGHSNGRTLKSLIKE